MEIRKLINDDFPELVRVNAIAYSRLSLPTDAFNSTKNLVQDVLTQADFKAWGLFEDSKLIGIVTGYANGKKSFYFSMLCVIIKSNRNLQQFIEHCFDSIKADGYTSWEVDCTNSHITKMMEKYGATPIYTRYIKHQEK